MISYGFLTHHTWTEEKKSPLEAFFAGVKSSVAIQRQHIELTSELYKKQEQESGEQLNAKFEAPRKAAQLRYESLLGQYHNPQIDHQVADHESGATQVENQLEQERYTLWEQFIELRSLLHHSALIQAYTLLEKELKDLCDVLKAETNQIIAQSDFSSTDYIGGSLKYLKLVILLDTDQLAPYVNKIRDIQYVRNRLIHDRGEISKTDPQLTKTLEKIKGIVAASKKRINLVDASTLFRITVNDPSYITEAYETFLAFFQQILRLVEEKTGYAILKSKLQRAMSSMGESLFIDAPKLIYTASTLEADCAIRFSDNTALPDTHLNLQLTRGTSKPVYCSYEGPASTQLTSLMLDLKIYNFLLQNIFYDYLLVRKEFNISLKITALKQDPPPEGSQVG